MNLKKNKAYIIAALLVAVLVPFAMKVFFSLRYTEDFLKMQFNSVMKDGLNRAAKFEDISIDFCGNLIISPFTLSVSNDFNDSLSLIKSTELVVDLGFLDLICGDIVVRGFIIEDAEIRILKSYGKDYRDAFTQMIDLGERIKSMARKQYVDFGVVIKNSEIYYDEVFKDEKGTIRFEDVYSTVSVYENTVEYFIKMTVPSNRNENLRSGKIRLKGRLYDDKAAGYSHSIVLDGLDLSYLTRYTPELSPYSLVFKGAITADIDYSYMNGTHSVRGEVETDNLHVYDGAASSHPFVSNENINLDIDCKIDPGKGSYAIKGLSIHDDNLNLSVKGAYIDNESAHVLQGTIESNNIDLEDVTHYFIPVENHYYSGTLSFGGDVFYDIKNNDARKSVFSLDLRDCAVMDIAGGSEKTIVSGCDMSVSLKDNNVSVKLKGKSASSDYKLTVTSAITSWNPLKSSTEASLRSKKMELSLLGRVAGNLVERAVDRAYADALLGYEDVFFLQKPISQYLINNDVTLDWSADLISVGSRKREGGFRDFSMVLELKKGVLAMKEFGLSGYGAAYTFDIQGYFAKDYPHCTMAGSARDFELGVLSADMGGIGLSGKASFNFDYALNIYRIAHILENSTANASFSVSQGQINGGPLLEAVKGMFKSGGYVFSAGEGIPVPNFSITTQQAGQVVYCRASYLSGDGSSASLAGKYGYKDGLDLAGSASVRVIEKKGETEIIQNAYVPLWIQGTLSAPCAVIKNKTARPYCF